MTNSILHFHNFVFDSSISVVISKSSRVFLSKTKAKVAFILTRFNYALTVFTLNFIPGLNGGGSETEFLKNCFLLIKFRIIISKSTNGNASI